MNVFYFEIENIRTSQSIVAIFANSAENASVISGRLMHSVEKYEPQYRGAGLSLFRQSGSPQMLIDALATTTHEGLAGYTSAEGWTVVAVPEGRGVKGQTKSAL